ncbi:hypothetical protein LJB42_003559 [Komagataella kurtzmanii]|nr:hypothetical protein LJB42_003559 [Komagataella kurtzmanii]
MNAIQFLSSRVHGGSLQEKQPQKETTLDLDVDQTEDSDIVTRVDYPEIPVVKTSVTLWQTLVSILWFFPNLLVFSPLKFIISIVLFPFRLLSKDATGGAPIEEEFPEDDSIISQSSENIADSSYSLLDTIAESDDIEVEFPQQEIDTMKSPMTSDEATPSPLRAPITRHTDANTIQSVKKAPRKKTKFVFPILLINNSFNLNKPPELPKKVLVLDLDETLIHSLSSHNSSVLGKAKGQMVEIKMSNDMIALYYIYKRPYVVEFLKLVKQWFSLVCFTASIQEYADPVIDLLEQDVSFTEKNQSSSKKLFEARYYRNNCVWEKGKGYIKDLSILLSPQEPLLSPPSTPRQGKSRRKSIPAKDSLANYVIIDNSPISYCKHNFNGIMVEGWINDPNDTELMNLLPLLNSLRFTSDVRSILCLKDGEKALNE